MFVRRGIRAGARAATAMAIATCAVGLIAIELAFAATVAPSQELEVSCSSPSLGGRLPAAVWLPAGYSHAHKRYPVIYFLHGLPAGPQAYKDAGFVATAIAASGNGAILVAPQGARAQDSDREYLNWGPKEDWPEAIAGDLPRCIDARFRTIRGRQGRALIGLSAGGFGAFNIGLRRLNTYAAIESWSGYFAATDPTGTQILNLGSAQANRRARIPPDAEIKSELSRDPAFIGFYVGGQDSRFYHWNIQLNRNFRAAQIRHRFNVYGGDHDLGLWARWAPLWVSLALDHLA